MVFMLCCLVDAQVIQCSCSEIPVIHNSSGSTMGSSGDDMLNVTGMYAIVTLLLAMHGINICDLILECQPSFHVWYFKKY